MKLTPIRALTRSLMVGMGGGVVLVLGIVVWRALREGTPAWTAIAFAGSAVVSAGFFGFVLRRSHRKAAREAEPMPADAEITERGRISVKWTLFGVAAAVAAVARSLDDDAIFAGVLTGMVSGAAVAAALALRRLARWEEEHGRRLLQHRKGGLRGVDIYYRETRAPSGRFERAQEAPANSDRVGRLYGR